MSIKRHFFFTKKKNLHHKDAGNRLFKNTAPGYTPNTVDNIGYTSN
jgi:hypothetical protein